MFKLSTQQINRWEVGRTLGVVVLPPTKVLPPGYGHMTRSQAP
jgi:hypothetical protein